MYVCMYCKYRGGFDIIPEEKNCNPEFYWFLYLMEYKIMLKIKKKIIKIYDNLIRKIQ